MGISSFFLYIISLRVTLRDVYGTSFGDAMSTSDIFGTSNSTMFNSQLESTPPGFPYSPITPNSLNSSPGDSSNSSSRNFDGFQFDCSNQNTPMKEFQRNFNSDCFNSFSSTIPAPSFQRSARSSLQFRDTNSPLASDINPFSFGNGMSSGSISPDSDHSVFSNMDNNLAELMNYLSMSQQQNQSQNVFNNITQEMKSLQTIQSIQTLNALKLMHLQEINRRNQLSQFLELNQILQGSQMNHCSTTPQPQQLSHQQPQLSPLSPLNANIDNNLDRLARNHRVSAALSDTPFRWRGVLPQKSSHSDAVNYSNKVFLGGLPVDANDQMLADTFSQFGPITVEWPAKERKGYAYSIFETENHVRALLNICTVQEGNSCNVRKYFFKIPGKYQKTHKIEVIPWVIADSNYLKSSSQKLDPAKTVFVGALHGQLTAKGLAQIMDDIFKGVIYAGIDTDKFKYPLGSGRVTFNNHESYIKAISTAFIEVQTSKFKCKVFQIDPYLEDSLCSGCGVQHGPYFCRQFSCYKYFCRTCWKRQHAKEYYDHKPMTRNSKSQYLVGIGPQINQQSNGLQQQSPSMYNNLLSPTQYF
ncbi:Cytoplasmic polyadenylation element-binding protein 1-B [Pseudolycoriella hygida]|uniref:Cytoplasmic polyadenylation element-binding protein 1-B n=1 Tax=Pseudolycoriella hygida TaxID=35572 RepID=A0A9Q0RYZ4_9DIPT|nr:Cytoplasmic polyadenylation element-binding protein 1-B [Pseudolycoriella hygida]